MKNNLMLPRALRRAPDAGLVRALASRLMPRLTLVGGLAAMATALSL